MTLLLRRSHLWPRALPFHRFLACHRRRKRVGVGRCSAPRAGINRRGGRILSRARAGLLLLRRGCLLRQACGRLALGRASPRLPRLKLGRGRRRPLRNGPLAPAMWRCTMLGEAAGARLVDWLFSVSLSFSSPSRLWTAFVTVSRVASCPFAHLPFVFPLAVPPSFSLSLPSFPLSSRPPYIPQSPDIYTIESQSISVPNSYVATFLPPIQSIPSLLSPLPCS